MNKMIKNKVKLIVLVSFLGLFFISADTPSQRYFQISKNMEILSSVFSEVNRFYVDDVEPDRLMRIGIDAMMKSLDPYTVYIPEDDIEDFRFVSTGQYGGVGAIIGTRKDRVLVIMPYQGFPAYKAGLRAGDEIVEIDGDLTKGKTKTEISKLLKGQAGTPVKLKIKRYGEVDVKKIELVREKVTIENVPYYGMVNNEVGYFKLTTFTRESGKNVAKAIISLRSQGAKKFIFDLRSNGGGLLSEAVNISGLFIPKGSEVVSTRGKVEQWNEIFRTNTAPISVEEPVVVLVNGRSASASEIVSGIMQDYDRGVLIGSQTYGKGLVQATMKTAYNSQVKVTTAKYYIPSGRCIQAIDYTNKDKNGKALKFADSLSVEFKTKNGRKVYDGKGLAPDIKTSFDIYPPVVYSLLNKDLIFDYATKYYYTHDSITSAKEYNFDDFDDFSTWVSSKDYDYKVSAEIALERFKETVVEDTLYNFDKEILAFEQKIKEQKKGDIQKAEKWIVREIEKEIVSRYHFQSGEIEASFDEDVDIKTALSVLADKSEYDKLLGN